MRPVPLRPIRACGKILGGPAPLICVPLVGKSREDVLAEVRTLSDLAPDIIELRVDAWDCIEDVGEAVSRIAAVRETASGFPIILTCRGHWEGGIKEVSENAKNALYEKAIDDNLVDFVDKELKYGETVLSEIKDRARSRNVALIISFHDFSETPPTDVIASRLRQQIQQGADVAKIALMPRKEEDVLAVLIATLAVRRALPNIPMITMSMGDMGMHSRVVGGLYGSDLTFAVGSQASAPGQIPIRQQKRNSGGGFRRPAGRLP